MKIKRFLTVLILLTISFEPVIFSKEGAVLAQSNQGASSGALLEAEALEKQVETLYQRGQYSEALSLQQRALEMKQNILKKEDLSLAVSFDNLGDIVFALGDYPQAESYYQKAWAIKKNLVGENHLEIAKTFDNLAGVYYAQGNYIEAETFYEKALAIRENILGKDKLEIAVSLNNIATVAYAQGDFPQAIQLYKASLSIAEKILGLNHDDIAATLNNLSLVLAKQQHLEDAIFYGERALKIYRQNPDKNPALIAISLNNLAGFYQDVGKYQKAENYYTNALKKYQQTLADNHPDIAGSYSNLAGLFWGLERIPESLDLLTQATEIEEYHLANFLTTTSSEFRYWNYLQPLAGTKDWTISLHLQDAPKNINAANLAMTTILRRKGRILDALSEHFQAVQQRLSPEDKVIFEKLTKERSQLAALVFQGPQNATIREWRNQIRQLERSIAQLESSLSSQSAVFRSEYQPITVEAVQKAIPADAALIEFVLYTPYNPKKRTWDKPHYAAYILHSQEKPQAVDLGEAEIIDKLIADFRDELQYPNVDTSRLDKYALSLNQKLIAPLRPFLTETSSIFLAPDSQLNLIPFAALKDENGKYLIENYSIQYLTSGRDLLKQTVSVPSSSNALLIGNPDYSSKTTNQSGNTRGRGNIDIGLVNVNSLRSWCCENLKGTEVEIETIAKLLPSANILMGDKATVDAIQEVKAPTILHLATHGFFLPQSDNPLLASGLALSGFNPQKDQFNGALTALEVSNLDLWGTKLVVLSACQTGLGVVANGEGVYGLRRAFVLAGAQTQVISLWNVQDNATKDLMIDYYQRLVKNEGRAEAMRQAQLTMLKNPNYEHPFYWAPFIVSGDWRSIEW